MRLPLAVAAVFAILCGPAFAEDCPQAASFVDVAKGEGPGGNYAKPQLKITCTADRVIVESNGIPQFRFHPMTPNPLMAQRYAFRLPRNPQPAAEQRQVPLLGPIGVAVNGVPIFGPNEDPRDGTADPVLDRLLDTCGGHTAQRGDYHFHAMYNCLGLAVGKPGVVVGYAFDGYPILAPYECTDPSCTSIKTMHSSWKRETNTRNVWNANHYVEGAGDLDRCNGRTRPDGSYAYYATETFPYFLACYHGVAVVPPGPGGGPGGKGPPPGGPSPFGFPPPKKF